MLFEGLFVFDSRHRYGDLWHDVVASDAELHKISAYRDLMRLLWRRVLLSHVLIIFFTFVGCVCNLERFRRIRN